MNDIEWKDKIFHNIIVQLFMITYLGWSISLPKYNKPVINIFKCFYMLEWDITTCIDLYDPYIGLPLHDPLQKWTVCQMLRDKILAGHILHTQNSASIMLWWRTFLADERLRCAWMVMLVVWIIFFYSSKVLPFFLKFVSKVLPFFLLSNLCLRTPLNSSSSLVMESVWSKKSFD